MAQNGDSRSSYPPQEGHNQGGYYAQQQSPTQRPPTREDSHYPAPSSSSEPPRQGQYPTPPAQDPRGPPPQHQYPPPGQWPGQHHSAYPPPPPHHYPDPQQGAYPYPPPHRPDMSQPPQPLQPDAYRLPPPNPPYYGPYYPQPQPAAPAPRQRTAIACKYCRKRKIRCSGYENSPDGRCQNCVRFNQQCLFHPVSSQAAFVPVSAIYGPNSGRAPGAPTDPRSPDGGQYRNGEQPPMMLYGAHGQPLGPSPTHAQQPPYGYPPPQGYPPQGYAPYGHYPPPQQPPQQPPTPQQGPPSQPGPSAQQSEGQAQPKIEDDRVSLKRGPPDDDPHNENSQAWNQSPHPNSRARHSTYDSRATSSGSYSFHDPAVLTPASPATSVMSHQSYPQPYPNGNQAQKDNNSPPGLTPNSTQSFNSPHAGPARDDGKSPPPQPNSASSSLNGRQGMSVHDIISGSHGNPPEQRGKNDNDMLSKLDGKK